MLYACLQSLLLCSLQSLEEEAFEFFPYLFQVGLLEGIQWINDHGNPFFHIIRDDGSIAYEMGLIGVPETFFIEKSKIQKKVQGPLFYEDIEKYL